MSRHDKTRLVEFYVLMKKNGAKKTCVFTTLHLLSTCAPSPLIILIVHLYIYRSSDLKKIIALNIVNAEHVLIICDCKITVYGRFFVNFYEWNNATLTFENTFALIVLPSVISQYFLQKIYS